MKLKYYFRRLFYSIFIENFNKKIKYNWESFPRRYDIINKIIIKRNYTSYLEIGCFKDETFNQINIKKKIGVDPVSGGNLRMTSDQFFIDNKEKFDLIFIDGLHVYEQVIKDIFNSIKVLKENGIILVHDCLPRKLWYQTPTRMSDTWNGDVWKAIVECRTLENIDTYTCLADEGIGVIKVQKNNNLLNLNLSNFKNLKYKEYYTNRESLMNIISVEKLINQIC
ncbi:class I SAM-dependent methyltransferase [Candidatus Pelagibacter sp.]|nr:class I SAM-dependent methyltransferase [Candidatus Pelagibacter sp.]